MSTSLHPPTRKRFRFKAPHRTPRPFTQAAAAKLLAEENPDIVEEAAVNHPATESQDPHSHASSASASASASPQRRHEGEESEEPFIDHLLSALSSSTSAQYYSSLYGQPIHIYPRPRYPYPAPHHLSGQPLSDNDYAIYVQARLWENTPEGRAEGAERRRVEREQAAMEEAQKAEEKDAQRRLAQSEKAEQERERRGHEEWIWAERVGRYAAGWEVGEWIPFPIPVDVFGGGDGELDAELIEEFFRHVAEVQEVSLESVVKMERVRWHPDKIMQRFGIKGATEEERGIMQQVNEVWRCVDGMYRRVGSRSDEKRK